MRCLVVCLFLCLLLSCGAMLTSDEGISVAGSESACRELLSRHFTRGTCFNFLFLRGVLSAPLGYTTESGPGFPIFSVMCMCDVAEFVFCRPVNKA